jgi:hypothetical protein
MKRALIVDNLIISLTLAATGLTRMILRDPRLARGYEWVYPDLDIRRRQPLLDSARDLPHQAAKDRVAKPGDDSRVPDPPYLSLPDSLE